MGTNAAQQDFTNWMQQANYPVSALSQVGSMFQNMRPTTPQSVSTESGSEPTNLEKVASVLGILNTGLNDSTIQSLLSWAGLSGAVPDTTQ